MKIRLWGTRGSIPTPSSLHGVYGGNTPCVFIELDPTSILILDGGTGLPALGDALIDSPFGDGGGVGHILVSHTHWAHIQGLPFFKPFLIAGNRFTLWGKGSAGRSIGELLRSQMTSVYCPVPDFFKDDTGAKVGAEEMRSGSMQVGDVAVESRELNHSAGTVCLGFRIESGGVSIAYLPDVEYLEDDHRKPALALAHQADLLLHDAHFSSTEYEAHRGWGHSSDQHAVEIAREADVRRLLLFHHHPNRTDADIDEIVDSYRSESFQVEAAREGFETTLNGSV